MTCPVINCAPLNIIPIELVKIFENDAQNVTYDKFLLPRQLPYFHPIIQVLRNISSNATMDSIAKVHQYVSSGFAELNQEAGPYIEPFRQVRSADNFVSQFLSFENATSKALDESTAVEVTIRTMDIVRGIVFCVGFFILCLVFSSSCYCVRANNDALQTVKKESIRYRNIALFHAFSSCSFLLGFIIFGAVMTSIFFVLLPVCNGLKKPDMPILSNKHAATNLTRSLLTCTGEKTFLQIAEETSTIDIQIITNKSMWLLFLLTLVIDRTDEFFRKLKSSVGILNSSIAVDMLNNSRNAIAMLNASFVVVQQLLVNQSLILDQVSNNLTLLKTNVPIEYVWHIDRMQLLVNTTHQSAQQLYQFLSNYASTNFTSFLLHDCVNYFDAQLLHVLPTSLDQSIIPSVQNLLEFVRVALAGTKCEFVSQVFDNVYVQTCTVLKYELVIVSSFFSFSIVITGGVSLLIGFALLFTCLVAVKVAKIYSFNDLEEQAKLLNSYHDSILK